MLEIQTFGTVGLRIRDGGESHAQVVQPKRLALLIYLARAPRRRLRRRDQIVVLFWPGTDQEHARAALSQALRYLRHALGAGAVLTQGEEEVGLDGQMVRCDASEFLRLSDADQLEAALDLYQGPFLDGFALADAGSEYEQWVTNERTTLRRRAEASALLLAERAELLADIPAAVQWARRAASISLGDELLAARLIRLLDQSGDRAGALRVYEDIRQRLKDEFQVAPSHEIQALIARILGR